MSKINIILPVVGASIITSSAAIVPAVVVTNKTTEELIFNTAINQLFEICKIPHLSNEEGHMDSLKQIQNYLMDTAKKYVDPESVQTDDVGNVWFDIPATPGYDDYQKLILQGHMDMVWACRNEAEGWDKWTHAPAEPIFGMHQGQRTIHSFNHLTNLGIDNGCALAIMLALAIHHHEFNHGFIRCVFTANEENGQPGSESLGMRQSGNVDVIDPEHGFGYLINLDSSPVGYVIYNSAGGYMGSVKKDNIPTMPVHGKAFKLHIFNCKGGHSGVNIGDNGANAVSVVANGLKKINENTSNVNIIDFATPKGTRTSIPNEAYATFNVGDKSHSELKNIIDPWFDDLKANKFDDPTMEYSLEELEEGDYNCIGTSLTSSIISNVTSLIYGATSRFEDEHNELKTSANIGFLNLLPTEENGQPRLDFNYSGRFQLPTDGEIMKEQYDGWLQTFATSIDGSMESSKYGPWVGNPDGPIAQMCFNAYNEVGIDTMLTRIHGGLECADFVNRYPTIEMVSIGPTVLFEHTVNECLVIDSYWKFEQALLNIFTKMNF